MNDGGTHLMIGPTTYFLCLSLSKLQQMEKVINGEDLDPVLSQHAYVEPDRIWIEDLPTAAKAQLVSDLNN